MQPNAAALRATTVSGTADSAEMWRRVAFVSAAILALAGVFTCCCDTPMLWDGSYQFCFTLIKQKPYFYLTRFHSYVLWLPLVWLSHLTSNLFVLKLAYGLPFTLAPAASVLLSWWVVGRRAPHLIIWGIFGAAAGPLPGQIFIINDSIFQQHMFWPVFLGLLVPLTSSQVLVLSLLVVFQFSHQIGLVLLGGGAGAAALLALRNRNNQKELVTKAALMAVLALIALWKIFHFPDSYAQREFTWERAHEAWKWGVEGYPLRGVEFMWAAGAIYLIGTCVSDRVRRRTQWLAGFCIFAAAVTWTIWALDSHKWSTALNYRRWVVPLTVPFYLLAFIDAWRWVGVTGGTGVAPVRAGHELEGRQHERDAHTTSAPLIIGEMVAVTFALILSIQSVVWLRLTHHLMRDVEAYSGPVIPWSKISWTKDSPLYHWGTTAYVFVLEGQKPWKLVLDPDPAEAAAQVEMLHATRARVPLSWFTPINPAPGPAGWFDFRPMVKQIRGG